jgi:prevent-host-death family protein
MVVVNIRQAKANLVRLLKRVEVGEEVVIARGTKPVARLVPIKRRGLAGIMKGKWPALPPSFFFDPLPEEELRLWEGADDDPL